MISVKISCIRILTSKTHVMNRFQIICRFKTTINGIFKTFIDICPDFVYEKFYFEKKTYESKIVPYRKNLNAINNSIKTFLILVISIKGK